MLTELSNDPEARTSATEGLNANNPTFLECPVNFCFSVEKFSVKPS